MSTKKVSTSPKPKSKPHPKKGTLPPEPIITVTSAPEPTLQDNPAAYLQLKRDIRRRARAHRRHVKQNAAWRREHYKNRPRKTKRRKDRSESFRYEHSGSLSNLR